MKKSLAVMAVVLALGTTLALDADAKRLGGGKSSGMQKQNTTQPATQPGAPAQQPGQVAPAGAAAAATAAPAAAAAKRSWMGPIAGLAAGLGIMALASHFGFGGALANMLTIALILMAVGLVVAFFLRKRAQANANAAGGLATAGAPPQGFEPMQRAAEPVAPAQGTGGSLIGSRIGSGLGLAAGAGAAAATGAVGQIPAGFDVAGFERNACDQFVALQAANDAGDLPRLRDYLTPEMFTVVSTEVAERGGATQATQVFGLRAQVLDVAEENGQHVVSVRFSGSVRDQPGAVPDPLDEVWHLVKPMTGNGGWQVAGIQQL